MKLIGQKLKREDIYPLQLIEVLLIDQNFAGGAVRYKVIHTQISDLPKKGVFSRPAHVNDV